MNRILSSSLVHRTSLLLYIILTIQYSQSLSNHLTKTTAKPTNRATFFNNVASAITTTLVTSSTAVVVAPTPSIAATNNLPKRKNISDDELKKIITSDIVDRSFLVSAEITRDVYDERSIFTDEIDSYPIDKWIKGTQRLFIADGSRVDLVGDVSVTPQSVEFRFDEDLMFNIPFRPVVSLTGRVVLERDLDTGLITSYREFWDQDVNSVLKTAKFGVKVKGGNTGAVCFGLGFRQLDYQKAFDIMSGTIIGSAVFTALISIKGYSSLLWCKDEIIEKDGAAGGAAVTGGEIEIPVPDAETAQEVNE